MSLPAYSPRYAMLVANSQCPVRVAKDGLTHYGDRTPMCGAENATLMYTVWPLVDCPDCRRAGES